MTRNLLSLLNFSHCKSGNSIALHGRIFSHFLFIFFFFNPRAFSQTTCPFSFCSFFLFFVIFCFFTSLTQFVSSSTKKSSLPPTHCHIFVIEKLSSSASLFLFFHAIFQNVYFWNLFFFSLRCFSAVVIHFLSFFLPFHLSSFNSGTSLRVNERKMAKSLRERYPQFFLSFSPPSLTSFSSWKHEKHSFFTLSSEEKKIVPEERKRCSKIDLTLLLSLGRGV